MTPDRQKVVDFSPPTISNVDEIVVTGPGAPAITTSDDFAGKEVFVRRSSSYYESLNALNAQLTKSGKTPIVIKFAPEELETEDILEMVNAGLVKITVADSYLANFWRQVFPALVPHPKASVRSGANLGIAMRKNSPQLMAEVSGWIRPPRWSGSTRRVRQLRREAEKRGLNPNVWFNNVERIASERIGRETVPYVANIFKYYVAYQLAVEEMEQRRKAKSQQ